MKRKIIRLEEIEYSEFLKVIATLKGPYREKQEHPSSILLSVSETASFFRVSKRTLANWNKHKILKKVEVGNRVYFRRKDIEELIQKNIK